EERQLEHHAEADGLGLEHDARPGRGADAERSAERRAERGTGGRDLVLRLERPDAEVLVAGELLEDRRGWRDRVRAEGERQARLRARGDEAERERLVPGDLPVEPRLQPCRPHLVRGDEVLARLAVVVAGLERARVRLDELRALAELLLDVVEGDVDGPAVEP